ncbi:MAG: thiamine phosphate synthase [Duncaniella sp.]|nr:thiamine phosphate synthase [Duncaniella sp.]
MKAIAITPPEILEYEASAIEEMLDGGWWRVHLRHPSASADDMIGILSAIPSRLHDRISVHDHFDELQGMFPGIGLHINSRQSYHEGQRPETISRSCHSIEEALKSYDDYCFISPVFDSISKPGYRKGFTDKDLDRIKDASSTLIALGGVDAERIPLLRRYKFKGFAMLGAIPWQRPEELKKFSEKILALC